MTSVGEPDNAETVLRLKQNAIRELREGRLPVNSLLWVPLSRLVRRIVPWGPVSSLVSIAAISSTPFVLGLLFGGISNQHSPSEHVSPIEGSMLMFIALLLVHVACRRWFKDICEVSELYMDEADVRRAVRLMLGSFNRRFQLSGTVALFLSVGLWFVLAQAYLDRASATLLGTLYLLPVAFVISNGAYWEIISLLSVRDVHSCRHLNVNFFDPASTIGIRKLSAQLGLHTLLSSIMLLAIFLAVYAFGTSGTQSFSGMTLNWWMLFALTVISSAFFYHQGLLYLIITSEKARVLQQIATRISEGRPKWSTTQLLHEILLFTTISGTRNTALRVDVAAPYATAILIQLLPLLVTRLSNLQ